jgi:hypothetical protein
MGKNDNKEYISSFFGRKIDETDFRIAKYRWEFLRRNDEFKKDFDAYREKEETEDKSRFPTRCEIEFCRKWKLGRLLSLNLEQSFDDFLKYMLEKRFKTIDRDGDFTTIFAKAYFVKAIIPSVGPIDDTEQYVLDWDYGDGITYPFLGASGEFFDSGILKIKVDLHYSKNVIEKEFKKKLDYWVSVYDEEKEHICYQIVVNKKSLSKTEKNREAYNYYLKQIIKYWKDKLNEREEQERRVKKESPISSKKQFKHYDKYLKIWDMRSQFPKPTFGEIGKTIYPQKPKKQAKDLAIQNYYAAYKLIYGKKYIPEKIRKEIKKEDLAKVCSYCQERETCKHLCPSVLPYYLQDEVKGERELLLPEIKYTKY